MTVRIEINDLHMLNANELRNLISYLSNTLEDALPAQDSAEDSVDEIGIKTAGDVGISVPMHEIFGTHKIEGLSNEEITGDNIKGNYLNTVNTELDSEGLPWDKRIHSMNKTKTKTGAWKLARNMTDAEAFKVKAELRKKASISTESQVSDVAVAPALIQETPIPTKTPEISAAEQFQKFIAKLLNLQKNNIIKAEDITNILRTLGLNTIVELSYRPELIASADVMLENIVNYEGDDE